MSDTLGKENRATPAATLEQQILDPTHAKNEREWWAADEITRLTAENFSQSILAQFEATFKHIRVPFVDSAETINCNVAVQA